MNKHYLVQDETIGEHRYAAPSVAMVLSLHLSNYLVPDDEPKGEVRVTRLVIGSSRFCDVFRLKSEREPKEAWPLAQRRTDRRSWADWEFVRRERIT